MYRYILFGNVESAVFSMCDIYTNVFSALLIQPDFGPYFLYGHARTLGWGRGAVLCPPPSSFGGSGGGQRKKAICLTFLAVWFLKGQHHKITTLSKSQIIYQKYHLIQFYTFTILQ